MRIERFVFFGIVRTGERSAAVARRPAFCARELSSVQTGLPPGMKSHPAWGFMVSSRKRQGLQMSLGTILLIILIVLLVGSFPSWPYSSGWGYYPAGGIGTILIIVLILLLLGRI
jgi:hypothetical protein